MENKIEKEYIKKAEDWFIENLKEKRKTYPAYEEVILDISKEIKEGKESNWAVHYYPLIDG